MKFKLGILMLVACMTARVGLLQAEDPKPGPVKQVLSCWTGIVQAPSAHCKGQSFKVGGTVFQLTGNTAGLKNGKTYNLKGTLKGPASPCPLSIIDVSAQTCG